MGLTNAKVRLRNPRLPELDAVEIDALADTGAIHLCIPVQVQIQLQLEEIVSVQRAVQWEGLS